MNYKKYVEQLKAQLLNIEASPQYDLVHCDIGREQTIEEILDDTEEFISTQYEGMEDFKVWEPFKEFYQHASWINFGWIYLGQHSNSFQNPCGASNIYSVLSVYDPFDVYIPQENRTIYVPQNQRLNQPFKLYNEYRVFDRIAIENETHIAVKFLRKQELPIFYYYIFKTKSYYKMSIGFDEYLELLLQTRGLGPWQEFFIDDSNFRLDLARAEQFLEDLELLFPEVDRTIFESKLAKKRAININSYSQNPLESNEKQLDATALGVDSKNADRKTLRDSNLPEKVVQNIEDKSMSFSPARPSMNYQKYIEQLKTKLLEFADSPQYDLVLYDIGSPYTIEAILEDEKFIATEYEGMENFKVWEPFKEFYQSAMWINFVWRYLGQHSNSLQNPCGASQTYSIIGLYDPEDIYIPEQNRTIYRCEDEWIEQPFKLYGEYRIFDRITMTNENHVAVKFLRNQDAPIFYYYTFKTKSYYRMSIGFDEYLELLLQTRGLSPWQEFFIDDSNFRIDMARAEQFLEDLELLFPEVDKTIFESQLAKLSGRC